jgi:hypothetical protein
MLRGEWETDDRLRQILGNRKATVSIQHHVGRLAMDRDGVVHCRAHSMLLQCRAERVAVRDADNVQVVYVAAVFRVAG